MRISFFKNSVVLSLALLFAAACGDGSHSQATSPQNFALRFQAVNAAQDVSCDKALLNLGTGKVKAQLQDFALYIHGLTFIKADGTTVEASLETNEWQAENVALLDFQDKADSCLGENKPTHVVIKGSIPNQEEFRAVRFTLGVPPHLNHVDPASVKAPLNATHMFWSWQSGYKSMRLDLSPEGGITRPSDPNFLGTNYFFHLGSTDCSGDPIAGEAVRCARVDQPLITLDGFNLQTSVVRIDINRLLEDLDLNVDLTDTPGCMSSNFDVECQSYFDKLGLDLVTGANKPGLTQSVFSLQ